MHSAQGSDLRVADRDPVRQLLVMGETTFGDPADWPDYTAFPGIAQEHVGALVRLACDMALHNADSGSAAVWAPLHAWRALARLRAESCVAPLLALLKRIEDDDAADLELPVVFGMIGPPAIPHIAAFIAARKNSVWSVGTAISGLCQIAARHAGCRGECVAVLVRALGPHAGSDPTINGFAVSALLDLRAVEAIDAIRDAFRRNAVDLSIAGDIEDVEIALGLIGCRTTPAPRYLLLPVGWPPWPGAGPLQRDRPAPARRNKVGRNEPCPCGSDKKYKKCCLQ